jgi:hypothetical protein
MPPISSYFILPLSQSTWLPAEYHLFIKKNTTLGMVDGTTFDVIAVGLQESTFKVGKFEAATDPVDGGDDDDDETDPHREERVLNEL